MFNIYKESFVSVETAKTKLKNKMNNDFFVKMYFFRGCKDVVIYLHRKQNTYKFNYK